MGKHEFIKVKHETVRRTLTVVSKTHITPRMLRIVFHSDDLAGFDSASPDDHVKIFFPSQDAADTIMRDFTPRAWDLAAKTITLEFALHQHGPATDWARHAAIGATLQMGGPRGSNIAPDDFDWYLLLGDATALPSIARRLEGLRAGVPVVVIALIADGRERQDFTTSTACEVFWVHAGETIAKDTESLLTALRGQRARPGDGFLWIAAEASIARELYRYATETMNHPKPWIKAAGYWTHPSSPNE